MKRTEQERERRAISKISKRGRLGHTLCAVGSAVSARARRVSQESLLRFAQSRVARSHAISLQYLSAASRDATPCSVELRMELSDPVAACTSHSHAYQQPHRCCEQYLTSNRIHDDPAAAFVAFV